MAPGAHFLTAQARWATVLASAAKDCRQPHNSIMTGYVKWDVEMTDTFGGEANYSWVKRGTTLVREGASRLAIVRAVKRELGINGVRCRVYDHGDMLELTPYGTCTVAYAILCC